MLSRSVSMLNALGKSMPPIAPWHPKNRIAARYNFDLGTFYHDRERDVDHIQGRKSDALGGGNIVSSCYGKNFYKKWFFSQKVGDSLAFRGCSLTIVYIHASLHSSRTVASGLWLASTFATPEHNWHHHLSTGSRKHTFAV